MQDQDVKTYPTEKNEEGFYYEDEGFEALGIETCVYDNGNKVHRVKLSNGATAIVRELVGTEGMTAQKIAGKDQDKVQVAYAALASKINGESKVMEDLLLLKAKDLNKLVVASANLNFL